MQSGSQAHSFAPGPGKVTQDIAWHAVCAQSAFEEQLLEPGPAIVSHWSVVVLHSVWTQEFTVHQSLQFAGQEPFAAAPSSQDSPDSWTPLPQTEQVFQVQEAEQVAGQAPLPEGPSSQSSPDSTAPFPQTGGAPATFTCTESVVLPPGPVQETV